MIGSNCCGTCFCQTHPQDRPFFLWRFRSACAATFVLLHIRSAQKEVHVFHVFFVLRVSHQGETNTFDSTSYSALSRAMPGDLRFIDKVISDDTLSR